MEVGDILGFKEVLRSWVVFFRGFIGGWLGWCWVYFEFGIV